MTSFASSGIICQDALCYDSRCQLSQNVDNIMERDLKMLNGVKIRAKIISMIIS